MSSPLRFPSSDPPDAEMQDEQNVRNTPPPQQPLFLAGTPSAQGTPSRRRGDGGSSVAGSSPGEGFMARRAVGLTTPRRKTPLFARKSLCS